MVEYIKKNDALEIVKRTSGDYSQAFSEILWLKAERVRPVVRGRWVCIAYDDSEYLCSSCKESVCLSDAMTLPEDAGLYYCPNCGAQMDGGTEDG